MVLFVTLSRMTFSFIVLSDIMLSVIYGDCRIFYCYAECRYAEYRGAVLMTKNGYFKIFFTAKKVLHRPQVMIRDKNSSVEGMTSNGSNFDGFSGDEIS
jgi:hypothetical protein